MPYSNIHIHKDGVWSVHLGKPYSTFDSNHLILNVLRHRTATSLAFNVVDVLLISLTWTPNGEKQPPILQCTKGTTWAKPPEVKFRAVPCRRT